MTTPSFCYPGIYDVRDDKDLIISVVTNPEGADPLWRTWKDAASSCQVICHKTLVGKTTELDFFIADEINFDDLPSDIVTYGFLVHDARRSVLVCWLEHMAPITGGFSIPAYANIEGMFEWPIASFIAQHNKPKTVMKPEVAETLEESKDDQDFKKMMDFFFGRST